MSDRFSEPFKTALDAYLVYIKLILEVQDWRINLVATYPDDSDASATIRCIYGQRLAELRLAKDFFDEPPQRQRHVLIHEMIHIVTDPCDNVIENTALDTLLGKPAYTITHETWHIQLEYLTDHLTYVVNELLDGRPNHDKLWANVLRAQKPRRPNRNAT